MNTIYYVIAFFFFVLLGMFYIMNSIATYKVNALEKELRKEFIELLKHKFDVLVSFNSKQEEVINYCLSSVYKLANPPKYNKGEISDKYIITHRYFNEYNSDEMFIKSTPGYWSYGVFDKNKNIVAQLSEKEVTNLLSKEQ